MDPVEQRQSNVPVKDLAGMTAPYNPRKITDHDLEALRRSLRYFGPVQPVVVNERSGRIVGGHQRVKAAQAEGIADLPVVYVDLDDPSEKQLNLALNRVSGSFDDEKLREVLASLEDEGADLDLTGFDDAELERLLQHESEGNTDPDEVPSEVEKRCEEGDVWELGRHRLMCGDATSADDIDPPYGVEYDPAWRNEAAEKGQLSYAARRVGGVDNDDRADWRGAWSIIPCNVIYAWSAPGDLLIRAGMALIESGFEIRNQIIWRKPHYPISRGHYTYQHEPCWYAVRKGEKADWIGDAKQSSVWEVALDKNVPGGHSTQKPVELFRRAIANHRGDVLEPFAGSGTCLIASEQMGRACYAMEVKPSYCDVILARWEAFTGEEAVRGT